MQAVVFDLDAVLINTEPIHIDTAQRLFRRLGIDLPLDQHYQFVGTSPLRMWRVLKERYSLSQNIEYLVRIEMEEQLRALERAVDLQPTAGIVDLLEAITSRAVDVALASSSTQAIVQLLLNRLGLERYFKVVVGGDSIKEGKPAPDIYLHTARLLQTSPRHCIAIEDSRNGVASAKAAGIVCVGYDNPSSGAQDLTSADLVVPDFSPGSRARILAMLKQ